MSLENVRRKLVRRLEEGADGARGWFVITRVHVALAWLKGIAEYLDNRGGGGIIRLDSQDFRRLATIIESQNANPEVQLKRHHLLVMDKPLQLLRRTDEGRWAQIELTDRGRALAHTNDPARVLEQSLMDIRFAAEPWTPHNRVARYAEFDVRVYAATHRILRKCEGYIDRDEFDFFVSRIRAKNEVNRAANSILRYRALRPEEQASLHVEVRDRIGGGAKAYSNWRDVALHTFSLFSLGTSMVRQGTRLLLTEDWVGERADAVRREAPAPAQLRMPEPPEMDELLTPPAAPASNDGADAESFVAKVLRSQGWKVAFYTNRRGYGFDLWARKEDRAMVVEVKSSLTDLDTVTLTAAEYRAAQEHAASYVLALVEHMSSASPRLQMIQNPAANLEIEERVDTSYAIPRGAWLQVANPVE